MTTNFWPNRITEDDDSCDVCDGTGRVQDEPTDRQRNAAKRFGWDCPEFFDRPCSLCPIRSSAAVTPEGKVSA
jgi:hypothetical protein